MANIDTLNIQINATTRSADKAIQSLENNVRSLNKSLGSINTSSLTRLSAGVGSFAQGVQGFKGISDKKMTKIANGISAIAKVDANNMVKLSNGLISMGAGLSVMNGVDYKAVSSLMNSLAKFGANASGFGNINFSNLGNGITSLANSLANAPTVSRSITSLMSAIARLSNAGGANVSSVTSALPAMGVAIRKLATSLVLAPVVKTETTQLVSAIGSLANAGNKTATTATNLKALGQSVIDLMNELKNAPEVSDKTVRLVTALGQLASAGSSTSRVFNAISNMGGRTTSVFGKMRNSIDKLTNSFKKGNSSAQGFISSIGMFYAKCWIAIRAVKKLWSAIESGADYVETYNYFRAAWNQVADNADLSSWKELGYKSAEEYAESFSERSKQLTETLSGYSIGSDGSLSMTGDKSLGIDPNMIMNYQAQFGQMASSMGVASENAVTLSSALSRIGLDLASVKNLNFTDTLDDLSSGLTGQSRVLDKYGINIRVAAMNEKLAQLGIDATASSLGQADKALLRTIIILDSSKYAWADLSETINAPSNQLRLLSANLSNAARMLGSLFLPIVKAVLPYVNALAIAVNRLLEYLGTLIGLDFSEIASNTESPDNSGISDYLDSVEEADDAQSSAADSAKEWKNQLMGFDEINKLDDNSSDSGSGSSGSGTPNDSTSALTQALQDALADYDTVWNQAYQNMENNSANLATKIQNAFKKAWKTGDGSGIGGSIASWVNNGIDWCSDNVSQFDTTLSKLASILGTSLNGFVKDLKWAKLGTTIGKSIKAALEAKKKFFNTVDWTNLGNNISRSLNNFVKTGVLETYAETLASKFRGIIELAFGAVTTFDFSSLGTHIGDSINKFFNSMNKVNEKTGLNGWEELGKTISSSISGFATSVSKAMESVNWYSVGQAIGDMLGAIDWGTILTSVGTVIWTALGTVLKLQFSTGSVILTIGAGLTEVAAGIKLFGKLSSAVTVIKNLYSAIKPFLTFLKGNPYIAIATGIVTLVTALVSFSKADTDIKVYTDLDDAETDLETLKDDINSAQTAIDNFNADQEDIEAEYGAIDTLATSYYNLSQKTNKTNTEQALMKTYAQELVDKIPELKDLIDDETGAYKGTEEQLKKTIKKTKEYYLIQAGQEDLVEISKSMYTAQKSLNKATSDYNKNLKKLKQLQEKKNKIDADGNSVLTTNANEYKALQTEIATYTTKVKENKKELDKQKTKLTELNSEYDDATTYVADLSTEYDGLSTDASSAKTSIDGVNTAISNTPESKSISYDATTTTDFDTASHEANKGTSDRSVTYKATADKTYTDLADGAKKTITKSVKIKMANTAKKLIEGWQKDFNSTSLYKTVEMKIDGTKKKVKLNFNADSKSSNYGYTWLSEVSTKANGGIFGNGKWSDIKRYANGGMPSHGSLYVAGENGSEIVGNVGNGKTEVLNLSQIQGAIAAGVTNAMQQVVSQMNNGNNVTEIYMDTTKVTDAILTNAHNRKVAYGQNVFMSI